MPGLVRTRVGMSQFCTNDQTGFALNVIVFGLLLYKATHLTFHWNVEHTPSKIQFLFNINGKVINFIIMLGIVLCLLHVLCINTSEAMAMPNIVLVERYAIETTNFNVIFV